MIVEEPKDFKKEKKVVVPKDSKEKAIHYLLPEISEYSKVYQDISNLISRKFNELHCCTLDKINEEFMEIINSYNLDIGDREVIITNGTVLAGKRTGTLNIIYKTKPFFKKVSTSKPGTKIIG